MTTGSACGSCGAAVSGTDRFCPACGSGVGGSEATRMDAATVPSQGSLERMTAERLADATTGEFEILERLGHGAMGSVYLARDSALSRRVAIKVISPQLLADDTMVARFRLEAQTVAALRHPHIVNLHGVRQLGDLHFFIMDFIDGTSLRALMKAHGPLPVPVTQALLFQVGSALGYAHRRGRGVIHRDVKPANIMTDREGNAVVMDFGISKVGQAQSGLTQTGATIGTPEYMSPEQCMDKELTGASDQYALGIVAYEMLTGAAPFKGSSYAVMMAHATSDPPSLIDQNPDCPPEVEAAVLKMLAKSPADRFPDMESAVAALGGTPLAHTDPVRDEIVRLVEAVSSDHHALDDSSPLSPVPSAPEPASLTILGLPEVVRAGDSFDLQVESADRGLRARDVNWSSSDPQVATIADGAVVTHGPGTASLTATISSAARTVVIVVAPAAAASVEIHPSRVAIQAGGTIALRAEVKDRAGGSLDVPVRWSTEDPQLASVGTDGVVRAVAPGITRIVAEVDEARCAATIEVEAVVKTGVEPVVPAEAVESTGADPAPASAESKEETEPGAAEAAPDSTGQGKPAEVAGAAATQLLPATRTSPPPWMAIAAALVVVLGLVAVIAWPAADSPGQPPAIEQATDDPSGSEVAAGTERLDDEGAPPPSNTATAAADTTTPTSPPATRVAETPTASGDPAGSSAQDREPAVPAVLPPATVRIDGAPGMLEPGARVALTAVALDRDGAVVEGSAAQWSSSDAAVATVADGQLRAVGPGRASVTAIVGAARTSIDVSVAAPAVEPPTREEATEAVQRFVALLRNADARAVSRMFGRTTTEQRRSELLERIGESNFGARLSRIGDVTPTASGATVDFDVQLSWRDGRGQQTRREMDFLGLLTRAPNGVWRLTGVERLPG